MPNNKKPHYFGHRKRLKNKIKENPESLADYEVLELLLTYALPRKDTKPLAKKLLARFQNFKEILFAKEEDLTEIEGLGEGIKTFWLTLREFLNRAAKQEFIQEKKSLTSPQQVYELLKTRLVPLSKEEVWLLMLDNQNRCLKLMCLSKGTLDSSPIYIREVLEKVIYYKAKSFILIHNHPGGSPNPSRADWEISSKIKEACRNLEVSFLDHIIIGKEGFISLKEKGL